MDQDSPSGPIMSEKETALRSRKGLPSSFMNPASMMFGERYAETREAALSDSTEPNLSLEAVMAQTTVCR